MPRTIKLQVRSSRKEAEALRLEIERLARRLGVRLAGVQVRRTSETKARPAARRRSAPRRGR